MVNLQSPVFNVKNTQMELLVNIEVTYLFWGKLWLICINCIYTVSVAEGKPKL